MFYGSKILRTWMLMSIVVFQIGCSGGGEGDVIGTGGEPVNIEGTAAVGAPIANAPVTVKTEKGSKKSTSTAANGRFQIEVEGAGPFLMRVEQSGGKSLFSIAAGSGTANIHPFTDLVLRNWFKVQGLDLETEFDSAIAPAMLPTPEEIEEIKAAIKRLIAQALLKFSLPADIDLITSPFEANGTGFDLFLDFSSVVINNTTITIVIKDQQTNIETEIVSDVDLGTDFTEPDTTAPTMPENLRAVPASGSEIVVVWDPSTDNIGVAGYDVYRNGELVATTPYPVYFDSGLTQGTDYCYEIEAFDGAGNPSSRAATSQPCPQTLGSNDNTPPAAPTDLQPVVEGANAISLTWAQTVVNDVYGFYIFRSNSENNFGDVPAATVTSTRYTDFNLLSSTRYCYQVSAFDAAGNVSARTAAVCATTEAGSNPTPTGDPRVEFSAATYQAAETDGTVLVTVNRLGNPSEEISVEYSAAAGTASADVDFVETNGTFSWAANDAEPKTFLVQIKGDNAAEPAETVSLELFNPSANVLLGNNNTGIISIADQECTGRITSSISVPTVVTEKCTVVTGSFVISNNASLTVNPGVTLIFEDGAGFEVRSGAYLNADGTAQQPIVFTSNNNPLQGVWRGIQFSSSNNINNVFDYVTLEYGGSGFNQPGGVVLFSNSRVSITNSVIRMNERYGVNLFNDNTLGDFSNNIITENEQNPIRLSAKYVNKLDGNSSYSGNGIDGVLVSSGGISEGVPLVWPKVNVDYHIASTINIHDPVTISAGVVIKFDAGGYVNVQASGSLSAVGTAENPIIFSSDNPTPGAWDGIQFSGSNSVNNVLDHVTVEYAGPGVNQPGGVVLMSGARVSINNSVIRRNSSYGINDFGTNTIAEFTNNTITENESYPVRLNARNIRALDSASSYAGNFDIANNSMDEVYVINNGNLNDGAADVWQNLDVPYSVGYLSVNDAFTIEAGATLLMRSGGRINVVNEGSLTAQGGDLLPITFTGAVDSKGSWDGVRFENSNNDNNVIDYVIVNNAGNGLSNQGQGNIILYNNSRASITNSDITNSSTYGVWLSSSAIANGLADGNNVFQGNGVDICDNGVVNGCPAVPAN